MIYDISISWSSHPAATRSSASYATKQLSSPHYNNASHELFVLSTTRWELYVMEEVSLLVSLPLFFRDKRKAESSTDSYLIDYLEMLSNNDGQSGKVTLYILSHFLPVMST